MEKILVTGCAGFIGSHICKKLLDGGFQVVGIDNYDPYYSPLIKKGRVKNLKEGEYGGHFSFMETDILDKNSLWDLFEKFQPHYLYHAAAKAGVRPSVADPLIYQKTNVEGSLNLIEALKKFPTKNSVFLSSSSVYGNFPEVPFREDHSPLKPLSPYAASKLAMEIFCETAHHLHGLPMSIVRPFTVYGPDQRPEMAIHFFTEALENNQPIQRFGDGSMERDFTYIDDFCQGSLKALFKPLGFEIFNVASSSPVTLSFLLETLCQVVGKRVPIETLPIPPGDVRITFGSIEKSKNLLGYSPQISLETGIQNFYRWYLKSKSLK